MLSGFKTMMLLITGAFPQCFITDTYLVSSNITNMEFIFCSAAPPVLCYYRHLLSHFVNIQTLSENNFCN